MKLKKLSIVHDHEWILEENSKYGISTYEEVVRFVAKYNCVIDELTARINSPKVGLPDLSFELSNKDWSDVRVFWYLDNEVKRFAAAEYKDDLGNMNVGYRQEGTENE